MYEVRWFLKSEGINDAENIRTEVFIKEQGFENEFDETDGIAHHIIIYEDELPVATARIFSDDNISWYIGRVAVLKQYRKKNIGSLVMNEAVKKIKSLGGRVAELSAQCRVQKFYEKMGFVQQGEKYFDEHCEHINMKKEL